MSYYLQTDKTHEPPIGLPEFDLSENILSEVENKRLSKEFQ